MSSFCGSTIDGVSFPGISVLAGFPGAAVMTAGAVVERGNPGTPELEGTAGAGSSIGAVVGFVVFPNRFPPNMGSVSPQIPPLKREGSPVPGSVLAGTYMHTAGDLRACISQMRRDAHYFMEQSASAEYINDAQRASRSRVSYAHFMYWSTFLGSGGKC